jgi:hypothetical protein
MASLDSDEVIRALKIKLGCREDVGRDHIRYELWDGEMLLSRTKVSHGAKHTIGESLINKMARQIGLGTNSNFVGLVKCSKSKDECLKIVRESNS